METIILSSSSPRRKEILRSLSIPFICVHPDIEEENHNHLEPPERVVRLAVEKAAAGAARYGSLAHAGADMPRFVLGADTLVAFRFPDRWETIGKPGNRDEARDMLAYQSGRKQIVFTGICLRELSGERQWTALSESEVVFAPMSPGEIEAYLDSGEWRGCAGAYQVQGRGSCFIQDMRGSCSGVMGLPIRELYGILTGAGYSWKCDPA